MDLRLTIFSFAYQDESFPPSEPDHVDAVEKEESLVAGDGCHDGQYDEGGVCEQAGGQGPCRDGVRWTDQFSGEVCPCHDPSHSWENNSEHSKEINRSLAVWTIPLVSAIEIFLEEHIDTIITIRWNSNETSINKVCYISHCFIKGYRDFSVEEEWGADAKYAENNWVI